MLSYKEIGEIRKRIEYLNKSLYYMELALNEETKYKKDEIANIFVKLYKLILRMEVYVDKNSGIKTKKRDII